MDSTNGSPTQHSGATSNVPLKVMPKKARPARALPTDRIAFAKQLDLLRAYAVLSEQRAGPVTYKEVADLIKMHPATVPLASPFFVATGFLAKGGQQGMMPSQEVFNYAQAHQWNAATSATKLAPVVARSWFARTLMGTVNLKGSMTVDDAITELSIASGASKDYRGQLDTLIDYLAVVGLVVREGNQIRRGGTPAALVAEVAAPPADVAAELPPGDSRPVPSSPAPFVTTGLQSTQGTVRFNVSVVVDMEEFAGWQPDRIAAFFGGIAQVLAAKAAVERTATQER